MASHEQFQPPGLAFDLANVTTNVLGDGFTLSGDLYVKTGSPLNFYFGFPGETDYGNFSLTASTVPEPGRRAWSASIAWLSARRRRS